LNYAAFHIDPFSVDLVFVVIRNSSVNGDRILEQDVTESAMTLEVAVNHNYGIYNHSVFAEILAEFIVVATDGEAAHEYFLRIVSR
jgi:hypothetical protein